VAAAEFVALAVPSVIIPGEWNHLLNPAHPDFGALLKTAPSAFVYDDRLD
jgi:RES domain-containing protein